MSRGGGNGAVAESVSLAMAFHQAPAQFPDLLHGHAPLPAGMGVLLRLAGGASLAAEGITLPFVAADGLKAAARFFIEQVLLAHDADYYRTLGVGETATLEEIKEHHRLLMWLYHPDRGNNTDEWRDIFATRINLAYTTLRHPESRLAYDAELRRARPQSPQPMTWQRMPRSPKHAAPFLPPFVARHFPQFVLGGFALLASLLVGMVYLNRQPTGAIGAGDADYTRSELSAPPMLAKNEDNTAATAGAAFEPLAVKLPPAPVPAEPAPPPAAQPIAAPFIQPSVPVATVAEAKIVAAIQARPADAVPAAVAKLPTPVSISVSTAAPVRPVAMALPSTREHAAMPPIRIATLPAPPVALAVAAAPAEPLPPSVAPATPSPAPAITQEALAALVARLSTLYAQGDLEGFLALFDENARIERGGKARIRSDYDALFHSTVTRSLMIWDMAWVQDGDLVRGEGNFQVKVTRKGESSVRVYNGTIKLEVLRRNESTLISGIFHKAA
ncbi:MAG: DnaJ domain-containing protein [Rugosibacter sp.]